MNPMDILILVLLGVLLFFAIRFLRRSKKRGGCPGCGGCAACKEQDCNKRHEDSE